MAKDPRQARNTETIGTLAYIPPHDACPPSSTATDENLCPDRQRILFVDDENELVELGKEMLEALGYSVTTSTGSLDALERFRAQPDAFDLIITDMTMPALNGLELARELLAIRPDLPIILCTGYSDALTGKKDKGTGIREVLMKPYAITDLVERIHKVLDATPIPPETPAV
ncbi:MAG: response regulator [Syntrophobacter sp.]